MAYLFRFTFTASMSAACEVSLDRNAPMICSSTVPLVMMCWMTTVPDVCPCLQRRATVCWYSSSDQVSPNHTIAEPPPCRFSPCPAEAGCTMATGSSPAFHFLILASVSSFSYITPRLESLSAIRL